MSKRKAKTQKTRLTKRITATLIAVIIAFSCVFATSVTVQANEHTIEFYAFIADLVIQARTQEIYNDAYNNAIIRGLPISVAEAMGNAAGLRYSASVAGSRFLFGASLIKAQFEQLSPSAQRTLEELFFGNHKPEEKPSDYCGCMSCAGGTGGHKVSIPKADLEPIIREFDNFWPELYIIERWKDEPENLNPVIMNDIIIITTTDFINIVIEQFYEDVSSIGGYIPRDLHNHAFVRGLGNNPYVTYAHDFVRTNIGPLGYSYFDTIFFHSSSNSFLDLSYYETSTINSVDGNSFNVNYYFIKRDYIQRISA